jgi:hypothetical protein
MTKAMTNMVRKWSKWWHKMTKKRITNDKNKRNHKILKTFFFSRQIQENDQNHKDKWQRKWQNMKTIYWKTMTKKIIKYIKEYKKWEQKFFFNKKPTRKL